MSKQCKTINIQEVLQCYQYKELDALRQLMSKIGDVRSALTNNLSELMNELLEDKDEDQELPFF